MLKKLPETSGFPRLKFVSGVAVVTWLLLPNSVDDRFAVHRADRCRPRP